MSTTTATRILAILCVLSAATLVSATVNPALCKQTRLEFQTGTCFTYPVNGICSGLIANQKVYLGVNQTRQAQDVFALTLMATLRANKGLVDNDCLRAGDAYACATVYPPCIDAGTEGIPVLPCDTFCQDFWQKCSVPFNQFNIGTIIGTGTFSAKDFSFGYCPNGQFGVGDFQDGAQPVDVFGDRFIRAAGAFPTGYTGQVRFPTGSAAFKLANGTVKQVACTVPTLPAAPLAVDAFIPPPTCAFPLVLNNGKCVIPCPFPVIPLEQQSQIGQAFVVPAIIALFLCVFVFVDSLFVIAESQGFNDFLRLRHKFLHTTSNMETEDASGTGVNATSKSGSRRRRNQLRAATLYSLLGSTLGIIFFFVGPMVTLIRGNQVSCGVNPVTIDLGNVANGSADLTDSFCEAQRVAPFLLQMIFNLILYAIVRVFLVVTERSRHWTDGRKLAFDILLVSYCAGIPLLFLIVALLRDSLSRNVNDFITQFSRNSAICVPRLTVADEVILVFLPFIVTGILITWLSLYIYMHLNQINKGVTNYASPEQKKNSSSVALRLLMTRLSFLGVATFNVLLVFISASATLMQSMAVYAPKFNAFFGCQASKLSQCKTCDGETALMFDALPSPVAFGAQIAAMSSISLLFGGFFAAQSFARLYKEYQDGSLQIKLGNLFHGRPMAAKKVGYMESSMHSFSAMNERIVDTKDAVKESCLAMMYGRYKMWRQSQHGRARGPVFRWAKRKTGPARKKFDFVPRAWSSRQEKDVQWNVVGGMNGYSETDSSNMTGSSAWNTSFAATKVGKQSESWAQPPGMSAWNSNFQPGSVDPSASALNSVQRAASPVFPVVDDDDDDTPRRPPSRCPSI